MPKKRIVIGSDHAGLVLKRTFTDALEAKDWEVQDMGPQDASSVDYPDYAAKVCRAVLDQDIPGILICGTGIGMAMTANRFKGIRAAPCANEFQAVMSRAHNRANVLCVGERVTGAGAALAILDAFLETEFEGGRHQRRVDKIDTAC